MIIEIQSEAWVILNQWYWCDDCNSITGAHVLLYNIRCKICHNMLWKNSYIDDANWNDNNIIGGGN